MDNEHSKLGQHYKESFQDFRPEPSPAVWEKLAQHPALQATPKPSWFSPVKIGIFTTAIVAVSILVYLSIRNTPVAVVNAPGQVETLINTEAISDNQTVTPPTTPIQGKTEVTTVAKPTTSSRAVIEQEKINEKAVAGLKEKSIEKSEPTLAFVPKPAVAAVTSVATPLITSPAKPLPHQTPETTETPAYTAAPAVSNPVVTCRDTMICLGENTTIWASGGESYVWSTGETLPMITVNPSASTTYRVTITDALGSQSNATVEVQVAICIYVPNAFTPDGDNLNDEFIVKGENIQRFSMVIFARNGQLVFESNDIQKGWDGKVKGNMGEPGSYTYKINYIDSLGKSHEKKGQLLLLR